MAPALIAGDGAFGRKQRMEVDRREDMNVETSVHPPTLGMWLPLTSSWEVGMFEKPGLLQPRLWPVRTGPTRKGGISRQGTGVPRVECSLGSPGLDLLLHLLAGTDTPVLTLHPLQANPQSGLAAEA